MQLSEIRDYVRRQTTTTTGELPDPTLDAYIQEAFNRTIAEENQWPFFENTWQLELPIGESLIAIPGDVNVPAITGLFRKSIDGRSERRTELMSHVVALETYGGVAPSSAWPRHFSVWAGQIHLWPPPLSEEVQAWGLTGFRSPTAWLQTPTSVPDCDERLHLPLAHYATALAYAQQEDEVLESTYMQRWQLDVQAARNAITEPSQDRPLVMGPHYISPIGASRGRCWPGGVRINTPI